MPATLPSLRLSTHTHHNPDRNRNSWVQLGLTGFKFHSFPWAHKVEMKENRREMKHQSGLLFIPLVRIPICVCDSVCQLIKLENKRLYFLKMSLHSMEAWLEQYWTAQGGLFFHCVNYSYHFSNRLFFSLSSLTALYHQLQHVFFGLWTSPTAEKRLLLYKNLMEPKPSSWKCSLCRFM